MDTGTPKNQYKKPPKNFRETIKYLGPGLIIAAAIVGAGELIATTKTGADAGFSLLWLIIIGCLIKVFVQIELGRFTIISGKKTIEALNEIPGPRKRVNWIVWYWLVMFVVAIAQLGGVIGGVGQSLAIMFPLTEAGAEFNTFQEKQIRREVDEALKNQKQESSIPGENKNDELSPLAPTASENNNVPERMRKSSDDIYWAFIVSLLTAIILLMGRYRVIQYVSAALVLTFTLMTIINFIQLQSLPGWRVSMDDFVSGLKFGLPTSLQGGSALATALATFGIIGVGATELIQYPYWCLEKGYARWTGPRENSNEWAERAAGWLRVLNWDAWISASIYTFTTCIFYLLGAAVLGRTGLSPAGTGMIRTLSEIFNPVFGETTQIIFIFGSVVVLYSTFFVAIAGHARTSADALTVFKLSKGGDAAFSFWIKIFCVLFSLLGFLFYAVLRAPVALVLAGGLMQSTMLPVLGFAALYYRYKRSDPRLPSTWLRDALLWISVVGLLVAGIWAVTSWL
jgi:Mn2+/Fe2+ NRAMP family transporter